ncbi:MAG: hypothetical protein LBV04_03840 [Deferribacteraceae bacterium]|jgi:hypothetical protein|nr:hypothetical protein [Deferribacteraceae bacterium]
MRFVTILIFIALAGCAQVTQQQQQTSTLTRDITAVDMSRDLENVRLVIYAKNGWLEQENDTLYVRFNAKPRLSAQAESALRSLFVPCRYMGVEELSLAFRCRASVAVYPEVTRDYIDLVFTP